MGGGGLFQTAQEGAGSGRAFILGNVVRTPRRSVLLSHLSAIFYPLLYWAASYGLPSPSFCLILQILALCYKPIEEEWNWSNTGSFRKVLGGCGFAAGFRLGPYRADNLAFAPPPKGTLRRNPTCWEMALRPASAIFTIPLANSVSVKGQSGLDAGFPGTGVGLSKPGVIALNGDRSGKKKF